MFVLAFVILGVTVIAAIDFWAVRNPEVSRSPIILWVALISLIVMTIAVISGSAGIAEIAFWIALILFGIWAGGRRSWDD